jgi:twitching motility protein PilT
MTARTLLDDLLAECKRQDASDIHLAPRLPPYLRVHGVLEPQENRLALSPTELEALAEELARGFDRASLQTTGSLDGALSAGDGTRYRFNVFRRGGQLAIALRRLEDCFRGLKELGLSESLYDLCELPDGLIVVAGPTGAGKSTTLATLIDRINRTRRCHIVTIEDPIEYIHQPQMSLVNQRQVGIDTSSFNDALVASLRQDPDVILVGEIRDLNTIRTAITAAETGHLVFTTVHAGDGAGTIERLVSVFPADEQPGIRRQLSLVLRAIVAQHLLIADGAGSTRPTPGTNGEMVKRRSRVVVSEVLMVTPAIANLIATAKSSQVYSVMEAGGAYGMQTLEQDLARLLTANLISETTAVAVSRNPGVLRDRVNLIRKQGMGNGRTAGGVR